MIRTLGLLAAIVMPLWNIPLIVRIQQRRSSADISLTWTIGVFACMLAMLPAALLSADPVLRTYAALNAVCFAGVVVQVLRYR